MSQFIKYLEVEPAGYKAMLGLEMFVRNSGLDSKLLHLIKVRASQINGCAFCLNMHTQEARRDGETEQRLYTVAAWHDTPYFTDAERAALAYTEQLTRVSEHGVSDVVRQELARYFTQQEIVQITLAIVVINGWNRLSISMGVQPE